MNHRSEILQQVAELRSPGKIISASRSINLIPKYVPRGEYITGFAECVIDSKPGVIVITSSNAITVLKQNLLTTQLIVSIAVYDIYEVIHTMKWGKDVLIIKFNDRQIELNHFHSDELRTLLNAFRRSGLSPRDETVAASTHNDNILFDDDVIKLLVNGRKTEATDLYVACTNTDMENAKSIIESLMSETRLPREITFITDSELNTQIKALLKTKNKIEAILLVRTQKGLGLKEAKDYVESL